MAPEIADKSVLIFLKHTLKPKKSLQLNKIFGYV